MLLRGVVFSIYFLDLTSCEGYFILYLWHEPRLTFPGVALGETTRGTKMIERVHTTTFSKLNKNVDLLDLREYLVSDVIGELESFAIARDHKPIRMRYVEVNSKNVEWSETFYLQDALKEYPFPDSMIEEAQRDMDELGLSDVRIRLIVMRVGSHSYYLSDVTYLRAPNEEDKPASGEGK